MALSGEELQPIRPPADLHGGPASILPEWPEHHPFHWLNAAEQGDPEAMAQLGLIYDRDNKNDKALYWYRKATDLGNPLGKERLEFLQR